MRKLFALSKPIEGKPRLIGELTEENGQYTFEYRLGGRFPEWFLQIDEFPDPDRKYTDDEVRNLIYRLIPKANHMLIEIALKKAKARVYSARGGTLAVCAGDNTTKSNIAKIEVPASGRWSIINVNLLEAVVGIQDLFVSLESNNPVQIDWISFEY